MGRGDGVDRHEPHIVAVEGVFSARIAEADKELHLFIPTERTEGGEKGRRLVLLLLLLLLLVFLWSGLGRSDGSFLGARLCGGSGGGRGSFLSGAADDGRHGEIALGDGRAHALRQLDRRNVHAIADLETGQIHIEMLGMASAGQRTGISWRTMFKMPPRLMPGEAASLRKRTGTSTVTSECSPTRKKST